MRHTPKSKGSAEKKDMATCSSMGDPGLSSLPTSPGSVPDLRNRGGEGFLGKWQKPVNVSVDLDHGELVQTIADGRGGEDVPGLLVGRVFGGQTCGGIRFGVRQVSYCASFVDGLG